MTLSDRPRTESSSCEHINFLADVVVSRVTVGEGGPVGEFVADVKIACADCGLPFKFVGVKQGLSYDEPRVSVNDQELRAPIQPDLGEAIWQRERPKARGFDMKVIRRGPIQ